MVRDFAKAGIELDAQCSDWTRLFRLPSVVRARKRTWEQDYHGLVWDLEARLDPASITPAERETKPDRRSGAQGSGSRRRFDPVPLSARRGQLQGVIEALRGCFAACPGSEERHSLRLAAAGHLVRVGLDEAHTGYVIGRASANEGAGRRATQTTRERLRAGRSCVGLPRMRRIVGDELVDRYVQELLRVVIPASRDGCRPARGGFGDLPRVCRPGRIRGAQAEAMRTYARTLPAEDPARGALERPGLCGHYEDVTRCLVMGCELSKTVILCDHVACGYCWHRRLDPMPDG